MQSHKVKLAANNLRFMKVNAFGDNGPLPPAQAANSFGAFNFKRLFLPHKGASGSPYSIGHCLDTG